MPIVKEHTLPELKTLLAFMEVGKEIEGCVYRLSYNGRYVILMGKTFFRSLETIHDDLYRILKSTKKSRSETNRYSKFYDYIIDNPDKSWDVLILLQSNNPYQLLKNTQIELSRSQVDPFCLNKEFKPHVPKKTTSNKEKTWVNKGYYLNFLHWQKTFLSKRTTG